MYGFHRPLNIEKKTTCQQEMDSIFKIAKKKAMNPFIIFFEL